MNMCVDSLNHNAFVFNLLLEILLKVPVDLAWINLHEHEGIELLTHVIHSGLVS